MKEENGMVIFTLLLIAIGSLVIIGYIVAQSGPVEPLNALVMVLTTIVGGLVGYLTKGAISASAKSKEIESE